MMLPTTTIVGSLVGSLVGSCAVNALETLPAFAPMRATKPLDRRSTDNLVLPLPPSLDVPARTNNPVGFRRRIEDSIFPFVPTRERATIPLSLRRDDDAVGAELALGENFALTFLKTGSNCLDLFFQVQPHTSRPMLYSRLESAWKEDPSVTLKLVFQLGDPRRGKGDRKNYYDALYWLYENQFESLLLNMEKIPNFSCYKALLDLLQMACEGPDAHEHRWDNAHVKRTAAEWQRKKEKRRKSHMQNIQRFYETLPSAVQADWKDTPIYTSAMQAEWKDTSIYTSIYTEGAGWADPELRDQFIKFIEEENQRKSRSASKARLESRRARKEFVENLYESNQKFRLLYDKVADIFASGLCREQAQLGKEGFWSGLAGKWAPSLKGSHDLRTNIVNGIVQRLYPDDNDEDISELRNRYRKEYLSPIRRAAKIPESFTGSGEWHLVDYKMMPSLCRLLWGEKVFRKHDQERYDAYVEEAKQEFEKDGKVTKISAGVLLPHELVNKAKYLNDSDEDRRKAEELGLQWLRLVQDVKKKGRVPSALAICDVSGSMCGTPMDVAIALSLLIGDIAEGAFANRLITFSENPKMVKVPEAKIHNLGQRANIAQGMDWGYNTDFQKVFQLLLQKAEEGSIPQEQMPSMLFCVSDMEFDCNVQGGRAAWKTDLDQIRERYQEAGYEAPHIVFWNVRDSISSPSDYKTEGVTMLSGFSAGLMKSFLEFRLEDATPLSQMLRALKPYDSIEMPEELASKGEITDLLKRQAEQAKKPRRNKWRKIVQVIVDMLADFWVLFA